MIVECQRHHAGLPVPDVPAAVRFYTTKLAFVLAFSDGDPPTFAGVDLGETQIFLLEGRASGGSVVYFVIEDVDALFAHHRANDVHVVSEPEDRPHGFREYVIRDPWGHTLVFGQYIYTQGPQVPVQRVDLSVRLEKRLAALLHDLARHKRMTVGECLEEALLHSFEPLGDGVASPHTRTQLRLIQSLKERHGLDYDVHDSYRFTETTDDTLPGPGASP